MMLCTQRSAHPVSPSRSQVLHAVSLPVTLPSTIVALGTDQKGRTITIVTNVSEVGTPPADDVAWLIALSRFMLQAATIEAGMTVADLVA